MTIAIVLIVLAAALIFAAKRVADERLIGVEDKLKPAAQESPTDYDEFWSFQGGPQAEWDGGWSSLSKNHHDHDGLVSASNCISSNESAKVQKE